MSLVAQERPAGRAGPLRLGFGRRKFDKQPTQAAAVLIATNGHRVPPAVVRSARAVAAGEPVAVVTIARVYGSGMGLPNPGLMPSRSEMAEQREIVDKAVASLDRSGVTTFGQIAATRHPTKTIVQVAKARGVRYVFVVRPKQGGVRAVIKGDLAKEVARKLGPAVTVEGVTP